MQDPSIAKKKEWSGLKIGFVVVCAAVLASVLTVWLARVYLFPRQFHPIHLDEQEIAILDTKIKALGVPRSRAAGHDTRPAPSESTVSAPKPEPYSEENASREIRLTERELNGLLARNTDLARKLAIDLSDDLASAKLLVPLDPEFPIVGGKVLKVTAGLELRYANRKPVIILRGVSIWGVPIPNAWLGGLKNIDLMNEFGIRQGFWQTFAEGIDNIRIKEGQLSIRLKP